VGLGTYASAAAHGEIVVNATSGVGSLDALKEAGEANLAGKILLDVANPLDFSKGMPPTLFVSSGDSLGERIQRALPRTRVVKTLNTVTASLMVDPAALAGGEHDMFVCGNDAAANTEVAGRLKEWFGWKNVVDLGDITNARGTEAYLLLWVRLWGVLKTPHFSIRLVR
jgi:predicted dinucleotide-binding enzyme